ncbi:MAG: hypothetical protein U0559_05000 [Anaerolineae bacterium]
MLNQPSSVPTDVVGLSSGVTAIAARRESYLRVGGRRCQVLGREWQRSTWTRRHFPVASAG